MYVYRECIYNKDVQHISRNIRICSIEIYIYICIHVHTFRPSWWKDHRVAIQKWLLLSSWIFKALKALCSYTRTLPSFHGLVRRMISGGSCIRRVAEINRKCQDVNSIPWVYGAASQDRTGQAVISSPSSRALLIKNKIATDQVESVSARIVDAVVLILRDLNSIWSFSFERCRINIFLKNKNRI